MTQSISASQLWQTVRAEAGEVVTQEPALASYYYASILKHDSLIEAIGFMLANKLNSSTVAAMTIRDLVESTIAANPPIYDALVSDICAHFDRDPACNAYATPLLYYKGFHALQTHRIAHELWRQGRKYLALYLQNRMSQQFGVDIHPNARIGSGIMLDHATGIVIGETAVLGNGISMLHSVTLGGTGCHGGDRHPKIGDGVLISAGAKVFGNIIIGEGARIGAGSVVLNDVPPHSTVAGVPARIVGKAAAVPAAEEILHQWDERET